MLLLDGFSVYGGRTLQERPIVCQWLEVAVGRELGLVSDAVRCCLSECSRCLSQCSFTFFIGTCVTYYVRDSTYAVRGKKDTYPKSFLWYLMPHGVSNYDQLDQSRPQLTHKI